LTGRLVSKLAVTRKNLSNPRWVVAFDEESWPEEDMYESDFGKIIGFAEKEPEKPRRGKGKAAKGAKKALSTVPTAAQNIAGNAIHTGKKAKTTIKQLASQSKIVKESTGTNSNDETSVASKSHPQRSAPMTGMPAANVAKLLWKNISRSWRRKSLSPSRKNRQRPMTATSFVFP